MAMNKAKDFWAPRKHGFDDDGPMAFAPRQRSPRPNGRSEGLGDEAPAGDLAVAPTSQPAVDATVKWYKDDKGFGFVELADGQGDAFLHATVLHAAGHDSVAAGAKLQVVVGAGAKGPQVARVISVDTSGVVERPRRSFSDGATRPPRRAPP